MALRRRALGLALGLVWGFMIMFSTLWLLIRGSSGEIISQLKYFYIGYTFSYEGAIIGFLWGFADGFLFGVATAWLYNYLSSKIYRY
jgi:hypothetical protein